MDTTFVTRKHLDPHKLILMFLTVLEMATLSACISAPTQTSNLTEGELYETRLYTLSSCPVTGQSRKITPGGIAPILAPVVSAFITPFVGAVVDKGVEAIKKAAEDKDFRLPPPNDIERKFYQIGNAGQVTLNASNGCIVLVRGTFISDTKTDGQHIEGTAPILSKIMNSFRVAEIGTDLKKPGAPRTRLSREPDLYFESSIVLSDDKNYFALRPQAIYVGSYFVPGHLISTAKRNYVITVTLSDAFVNTPFASAEFKFTDLESHSGTTECADVKLGEYCSPNKLGGMKGWFPTKPSSDEITAVVKERQGVALMVAAAAEEWKVPTYVGVAQDEHRTVLAQKTFCTEVAKFNSSHPPTSQISVPECPISLWSAKRAYDYAVTVDNAVIDKRAADKFWADQCPSIQRSKEQVAGCLESIFTATPAQVGKFTIHAEIIETRLGSKFAKFFVPVTDGVSPQLKGTVISQLDPTEREKTRAKAKADSETASTTARIASRQASESDLKVRIAQTSYDAAIEKLSADSSDKELQIQMLNKQIELLQQQRLANDLYRAAGRDIPYPNVD